VTGALYRPRPMAPTKMVAIDVEETSGVDHPAHLVEGWVVVKAADPAAVAAALNPTVEDTMPANDTDTKVTDLEKALADAQAEIAVLKAAAVAEPTAEPPLEDLLKSVPEPVREMLAKAQADADEARKVADEARAEVAKAREVEETRQWVAKAAAWTNLSLDAAEVGPLLRRLHAADADLAKAVEGILSAADATAESAALFTELGTSKATTGDAYSQIETLAKARVAAGESPNLSQAIADLAVERPALYSAYLTEQKG